MKHTWTLLVLTCMWNHVHAAEYVAPPPPTPGVPLATPQAAASSLAPPAANPAPANPQTATIQLAVQQQQAPVASVPITLQVTAAQPAPAPVQQPVNVQITAANTASTPVATTTTVPTVAAEVHHAGPLGRAIARFGDKLTRAGYDKVLIPRQQTQAVIQPAVYNVASQAVNAVQYTAAPVQIQTQAVTASPQSAHPIKRLFGR